MVRRALFKVRQQAVIIHRRKVLLLKYSDYTRKKTKWDFPGGHVVHGEDAFESLRREVEEETGLIITDAKPMRVLTYDKGYLVVFAAKAKGDGVKLSKEHTDYAWVTSTEAEKLDLASSSLKDDIRNAIGYF
ncbi:MAG: NUDIX domain-containing protein [Nanoarchaeota archaeon]